MVKAPTSTEAPKPSSPPVSGTPAPPRPASATSAPQEPDPAKRVYSAEEQSEMRGDLRHGQMGWMTLDERGEPTGEISLEPPPPGTPCIRVVVKDPKTAGEVLTPSGAPITKHMNPEAELWDEGMKARNPVPPATEPPSEQQKRMHSAGVATEPKK